MSTVSESWLQPTSELLGGDSNIIKKVAIVGVSWYHKKAVLRHPQYILIGNRALATLAHISFALS
jgi:hypothetical protein